MPDEAEPRIASTFHTDRASARTADEREAHFQAWLVRHCQPYEAAVLEAGGTPWTTDVDERRALWGRRYSRPNPPQGLLTDLEDIRA